MPNDQLTRLERIRLESLAQAVGCIAIVSDKRPSLNDILDNAEVIESFLLQAEFKSA